MSRSLVPVATVYVVAAFVAAPLAVGWAVSHTRGDEQEVADYQLFDVHADGSAVAEARVDVGHPTDLAGLADGRYPDDRETTGG